MATKKPPAPKTLIDTDPWLKPYGDRLAQRDHLYRTALAKLEPTGGLEGQISHGHEYFGFNRGEYLDARGHQGLQRPQR